MTASGSAAERGTAQEGSRVRQLGFWNAVTGMLMAVVMACGAVAMEIASEAQHRAAYLRRRFDVAQEHAAQLEVRLGESKRELAEIEDQAEARHEFTRILSNPDGRLVRLRAINPGIGAAGLVAMSSTRAVLEVTDLPALAPNQHYSLRWLARRGAPIPAGQVFPSERGQIETAVRLSAPPAEIDAVELMLVGIAPGGKLVSSTILKGAVPGTKS